MINPQLVQMLTQQVELARNGVVTDAVVVGMAATGQRSVGLVVDDMNLAAMIAELDMIKLQLEQLCINKRVEAQQRGSAGIVRVPAMPAGLNGKG